MDGDRKYRVTPLANGNTLVVTWSASKAGKDAHERKTLLERLNKKLNKNGEVSAERLIGNRGTTKYLEARKSERMFPALS